MAHPPHSSIPTPSHSWADKVRVSCAKNRFALKTVVHSLEGDIPRISVPIELTDSASSSKWDRCLVGYFPGPSMPFHAVRAIAARIWKPYGLESSFASDGFFVFRFAEEDSLHSVLQDGPWMFGGKAFILQQWSPSFVFNKEMIKTVPVWIKLHGLPFPLWTEEGLSFVASIVGKPIACDKATHDGTRLAYARICVEIEAGKPPVHLFDLDTCLSTNPIRVKVDYEWKPKRCVNCNVFGHDCRAGKDEATRHKKTSKIDPMKPTDMGEKVVEKEGLAEKEEGQNGPVDSPWITVQHKTDPSLRASSRVLENSNLACPEDNLCMVMYDVTTSKASVKQQSYDGIDSSTPTTSEPLALLPPFEPFQASPIMAKADDNPSSSASISTCAINTEASPPKSPYPNSLESPLPLNPFLTSHHVTNLPCPLLGTQSCAVLPPLPSLLILEAARKF